MTPQVPCRPQANRQDAKGDRGRQGAGWGLNRPGSGKFLISVSYRGVKATRPLPPWRPLSPSAVHPFGYVLLVILPLLMFACGGSGARALIPVDIAPGTVAGVATVDVVVTDLGMTGRELRRQRFDWKPAAGRPLQVGVYLPEGVSGSVAVQARAFNASPASIGLSNQVTVMVSRGQRTPLVQLLLAPTPVAPTAAVATAAVATEAQTAPGTRRHPTPDPPRRPRRRRPGQPRRPRRHRARGEPGLDHRHRHRADPLGLVVHPRRGHRRRGQRAGRLARRRGREAAPPRRRHPQLGRHPDHRGSRHHRRCPGGDGDQRPRPRRLVHAHLRGRRRAAGPVGPPLQRRRPDLVGPGARARGPRLLRDRSRHVPRRPRPRRLAGVGQQHEHPLVGPLRPGHVELRARAVTRASSSTTTAAA